MSDKPVEQLSGMVSELLAGGLGKEDILSDLEALRSELAELDMEKEEDVVLDVMDFVTGWCVPHQRL